jgi:signal transduction histidine kinase
VLDRRWVVPASAAVLALLVVTTLAAVVVTRDQVAARLTSSADRAVQIVRQEVELALDRDVAAAAGLARSVADPTAIDAEGWTDAVESVARVGAFSEASAVNLAVVATGAELEDTLGSLPASVRDSLDLRVSDGDLHAVIAAVWPSESNRAALGFDVTGNAEAARAVTAAIENATVQASRPLRIVQEPTAQRSTVVYVPVIAPEAGRTVGVVNLVFRAGALVSDVAERLPSGAHVRWLDSEEGLEPDAAILAEVGDAVGEGITAVETIDGLGRSWRLEVTLPPTAAGPLETRAPLLVGLLGAVLSLGLLVTLAAWRSTTRRADELAARRTAALTEATGRLEDANRELQELDRFKDRLLRAVSHDLRAPLTVITGSAALLRDRELPPAQRTDLIDRLLRQASRLRGLIDELLLSAQVRAGAVQPDLQPLDLAQLVTTTVDDLGVGRLLPPSGPLPQVLADRAHVERMLHNLLTNAADHGAPPVEVELANGVGPHVELCVRDHGPGIPEELRSQVFDEFARSHSGGGGYGLGLAIVTELARANGGSLTYRDVGAGACFVLTLPIATAS